jgi:hypothetical protein
MSTWAEAELAPPHGQHPKPLLPRKQIALDLYVDDLTLLYSHSACHFRLTPDILNCESGHFGGAHRKTLNTRNL